VVKRIILVRHAEAPHKVNQEDIDRALNQQGIAEAKELGVFLHKIGLPELVLCSDVKRTKQTLTFALADKVESDYIPALYQNSCEVVMKQLMVPDVIDSVLVMGHNPSTTDMVSYLDCLGKPEVLARANDYRPTAKAIVIESEADFWYEIESSKNTVEQVFIPGAKSWFCKILPKK
jgi:phosphohistidine phosphatase SixA